MSVKFNGKMDQLGTNPIKFWFGSHKMEHALIFFNIAQ